MRYIVWEWIDAYSGYNETSFHTWEEVVKCVKDKVAVAASYVGIDHMDLFAKWESGESDSIEVSNERGQREYYWFVTTAPLNQPVDFLRRQK